MHTLGERQSHSIMKSHDFLQPLRVGQIVPSINTTMEVEVATMLRMREAVRPERFSLHSSRTRLKHGVQEALNGRDQDSVRCLDELTDAKVDVVSYSCFAALMEMGPGYHRVSQNKLQRQTAGTGRSIPVITSAGALVDALQAAGMKRISLICPHERPLADTVVRYLEREGVAVHDYLALGCPDNLAVRSIHPSLLGESYKRLSLSNIDGLVLSACVHMRSLPTVQQVENELGVPTLSVATATTWKLLKELKLSAYVPGCGHVLSGRV